MYLRSILVWTKPGSRFLAALKAIGIILLVVVILAVIGLVALLVRRSIIIARQKEQRARRRAELQAQRTGIMEANVSGKSRRRRPGSPTRPAQWPPSTLQRRLADDGTAAAGFSAARAAPSRQNRGRSRPQSGQRGHRSKYRRPTRRANDKHLDSGRPRRLGRPEQNQGVSSD